MFNLINFLFCPKGHHSYIDHLYWCCST